MISFSFFFVCFDHRENEIKTDGDIDGALEFATNAEGIGGTRP